jgi:hypothetical protein
MTGPSARSANVVVVGEAKKVCFVVSPMGERDSLEQIHADWLVSEIIEPVVREVPGFIVKRADHHKRASPINAQVMHYLLNSELVIADLSTHDAYVFYDIAIRHISRKPIIHMHREGEKLPFDASLCESIGFSRLKPSDLRTARAHLRQVVDSVLEEGYEVVNPISQFFGRVQVAPMSSRDILPAAVRTPQPSIVARGNPPAEHAPSLTTAGRTAQPQPETMLRSTTAVPVAAPLAQPVAENPPLDPAHAKVSPEGLDAIKARLEARLEEMQTGHEEEEG